MKILPASGGEWLATLLIPFKVFVPAGYLMVVIQQDVLGYRMDTGAITPVVVAGYLVSFPVLVCGALVQHRIGPRKAYLSTCAFAAGVLVFGLLLLPYLTHT